MQEYLGSSTSESFFLRLLNNDGILKRVELSLINSDSECQKYFLKFLISHKRVIESIGGVEEVLCEFEDMDQYHLSPIFRYLSPTGDVGTDIPDITEEGEEFFSDSQFMPKETGQKMREFWQCAEDDSQYYKLKNDINELIKNWLLKNWLVAIAETGIETPLYYCEHHSNHKTMNLMTKEERVLF